MGLLFNSSHDAIQRRQSKLMVQLLAAEMQVLFAASNETWSAGAIQSVLGLASRIQMRAGAEMHNGIKNDYMHPALSFVTGHCPLGVA